MLMKGSDHETSAGFNAKLTWISASAPPLINCLCPWGVHFTSWLQLCMCAKSCALFVTIWTIARQASLFIGFSRQEYWSGLPFPPPGDLPNPRIEPASLMSPALVGGFFTTRATLPDL